ncbi:MAG: hypothetical protein FWF30_00670, partial [Coriobacteriia bacterium]|nr:hypothetical protein [Coriobacteriia bacterium]
SPLGGQWRAGPNNPYWAFTAPSWGAVVGCAGVAGTVGCPVLAANGFKSGGWPGPSSALAACVFGFERTE